MPGRVGRQSQPFTIAAIWNERDREIWKEWPELYEMLGNAALKAGEPLIAFDVLQEGLTYDPGRPRLRQLQALALSRSGAAGEANGILAKLFDEGNHDEETLSILASTHKSLGQLRDAYRFYVEAYESTSGYYPGINAATLAVVLGDQKQGGS